MEQVLRVAAYAVVLREGEILLSRLAPHLTRHERWTLPGGGVEHGEDPRDAVVREVYEETGLKVTVGEAARTDSLHLPDAWRQGRRVDAHSLRILYEGWVSPDSPEPHVVEVDGSTVDAAWKPIAEVLDGTVPTVGLVRAALVGHQPVPRQRLAAYGLARRERPEPAVLLTRVAAHAHHGGAWTLPGGGVEHGENPRDAVRREVAEETGLTPEVGALLDVHDVTLRGNAPTGREEDYHGVHLIFAVEVDTRAEPRVVEADGTTDRAAWVPLADVEAGRIDVLDVVRAALNAAA